MSEEPKPPPTGSKEQDSEESIRWLRERGVTVETPEDRKRSTQICTTYYKGQEGAKAIEFVRIPCDQTVPLEELVCYIPKGADGCGDKLPEMLKTEFTKGKVDNGLFQRTAKENFGEEASKINASTLQKAVAQGSTETFRLVAPAETNDYHGVYIYLDEVGMLKGLPENGRATALAEACGFGPPPPVFYGDVYVGRVKTRPSPMRNVSFKKEDMDSSKEWIQRAQSENFEYHEAMGQVTDSMDKSRIGGPAGDDGVETKDASGAFTWCQTPEDVEVTIPVGKQVNKKLLKVNLGRSAISVKAEGDVKVDMALSLYAPVDMDSSTWSLVDTNVVITLEKTREEKWPQIRKTMEA